MTITLHKNNNDAVEAVDSDPYLPYWLFPFASLFAHRDPPMRCLQGL